jgi:hypothetical protein
MDTLTRKTLRLRKISAKCFDQTPLSVSRALVKIVAHFPLPEPLIRYRELIGRESGYWCHRQSRECVPEPKPGSHICRLVREKSGDWLQQLHPVEGHVREGFSTCKSITIDHDKTNRLELISFSFH